MPLNMLYALASQPSIWRAWGWSMHMQPAQCGPPPAFQSNHSVPSQSRLVVGVQGAIHYLSPMFNNCGYPPGPANYYPNAFSLMSSVLYPMNLLWTVRPNVSALPQGLPCVTCAGLGPPEWAQHCTFLETPPIMRFN